MRSIVTAGLTALIVAALVTYCLPQRTTSIAKETAYARVLRTGTLRCAWYVMPPFFQRDPNTGAFSGVYFDVMEEMGRQLQLKIVWTEEVAGATAYEGLQTNRYDAVCAAFAPLPARAKVASFTMPLSYRPIYAYVRAADTRFDNHSERIDDPSVKISVIEGQGAHLFAQRLYPKASLLILPSFSDLTQNELNVADGKADLSLAEASTAARYMASNPGKIRRATGAPLIRVADTIQVGPDETALKDMLDSTLGFLNDIQVLKRVHEKYLGPEGEYYILPASTHAP